MVLGGVSSPLSFSLSDFTDNPIKAKSIMPLKRVCFYSVEIRRPLKLLDLIFLNMNMPNTVPIHSIVVGPNIK